MNFRIRSKKRSIDVGNQPEAGYKKYINVEGSGIIEGTEVYGFQAYLTDHSKKTYYWVSSPGDKVGYEWWANNCTTENVPAVCKNSGGTTPLNAIKLRLG